MKNPKRCPIVLAVLSFAATFSTVSLAQQSRSVEQARAGIERLHALDVETTLSGKADDLAKLWDKDAVRLLPDSPVDIGKAAIYATDKKGEAAGEGLHTCYKPDIKDVQIAGDVAFEWGYFAYKESPKAKVIRGKLLRVMKREPDGTDIFCLKISHLIDRGDILKLS